MKKNNAAFEGKLMCCDICELPQGTFWIHNAMYSMSKQNKSLYVRQALWVSLSLQLLQLISIKLGWRIGHRTDHIDFWCGSR